MTPAKWSVTVQSMTSDTRKWEWSLIALAGATWSTGLCRVLALDYHVSFFFGATGTILVSFTGFLLAILVALHLKRRGANLTDITQQFLPLYLPLVDILIIDYHPWRGAVLLIMSLFLVLLFKARTGHAVGFVMAVLVPLLIYLPDVSPFVGRADTFEFQVVAPKLGIAHPSGYPLYIFIGKLFSMLPVGTTAWRVNLSSSVMASLASGVLYLTVYEWTCVAADGLKSHHRSITSLLCSLTMAFSPTLWSRAVEAEVYALNAFIVTLALLIACGWYTAQLHSKVALPLLGALTGLALASHITLGALAGIVIMVMVHQRDEIQLKTLLLSIVLGLAGLTLYLFIPLRWSVVTGGDKMSLDHFIRFVTNAESGGALLPRAFLDDPARWSLVFRLIRQQVGLPGLLLASVGLITLIFQNGSFALGAFLSFSAWVWFSMSFYVAEPDYSAFLIPAHVVIFFWLGIGATTVFRLLERHIPGYWTLGLVALSVLPASRLWTTGPQLDTKSLGLADEQWGRYVMDLPVEKEGVILADSEKFPPLYYLQQVENIRADLILVTAFNEVQYRDALTEYLAQKKDVYMARYLPGLDEFGISSVGPLVRVSPEPQCPDTDKLNIIFGDSLLLCGFSLVPDPEGRPMHHLTLYWYSSEDIQQDLEVRIRLKTQNGDHIAWVNNPTRPVGGYSSTTAWKKGTAVQDYYPLTWPDWLPAANYVLQIGLFPRFGEDGLLINGNAGNWVSLSTQTIGTSPGDYQTAIRSMSPKQTLYSDGTWLTGVDITHEVLNSSTATADMIFFCSNQLTRARLPQFYWIHEDGTGFSPVVFYEQSSGQSIIGNLMCKGQEEVRRFTLSTPAMPGNYILAVGLLDEWDDEIPARCQWLGKIGPSCPIAQVTAMPMDSGIANYDKTLLLLDAELDEDGIAAGGPLSVSLHWRGLRSMDKDYTMFLQVIGPDGQIYGQIDSWPQQGGRPTSGWGVGEEIHDQYSVYIKESALPGEYNVIIGWYLLADMGRIPIVTDTGQIVNDFYSLGSFHITHDGGSE